MSYLYVARAGDVIWYYKTENKEAVSLNSQEISISKYYEMLVSTIKDALEVLGHRDLK